MLCIGLILNAFGGFVTSVSGGYKEGGWWVKSDYWYNMIVMN